MIFTTTTTSSMSVLAGVLLLAQQGSAWTYVQKLETVRSRPINIEKIKSLSHSLSLLSHSLFSLSLSLSLIFFRIDVKHTHDISQTQRV